MNRGAPSKTGSYFFSSVRWFSSWFWISLIGGNRWFTDPGARGDGTRVGEEQVREVVLAAAAAGVAALAAEEAALGAEEPVEVGKQ